MLLKSQEPVAGSPKSSCCSCMCNTLSKGVIMITSSRVRAAAAGVICDDGVCCCFFLWHFSMRNCIVLLKIILFSVFQLLTANFVSSRLPPARLYRLVCHQRTPY